MTETPESPPPPPIGEPYKAPKGPEDLSSWHRMAGVGVEFIAAFGLLAAVGWWLDKKFATAPWLLLAGCGLGFTIGLWSMLKAAAKVMK